MGVTVNLPGLAGDWGGGTAWAIGDAAAAVNDSIPAGQVGNEAPPELAGNGTFHRWVPLGGAALRVGGGCIAPDGFAPAPAGTGPPDADIAGSISLGGGGGGGGGGITMMGVAFGACGGVGAAVVGNALGPN